MRDFIVFGEDFSRHPHALEHLLRPLFSTNRFIWVETIGLRSPRFKIYDFFRIIEKIYSWILALLQRSTNKYPHNVTVIKPFMIPFNQFNIIRRFNTWNVLRKVNFTIKMLKMNNIISISSVPNAGDYLGGFGEKLKVYYCVDEFSLWPGLNLSLVKKLEELLISKVDLIIATSQFLSESKLLPGKKTPIITHGVDFHHFNIETSKKKFTTLKICYFGLFDERTNQEILIKILKEIKNCELHILGNVICNIKNLKNFSNIIFHGNISYYNLPRAVTDMDIFILPYCRNSLTDNINPLKLKEYLSTGRPVVATNLPEVTKLNEYIFVANDSNEFINIIEEIRCQIKIHDSKKVIEYVSKFETWEAKSKQLLEILEINNC